jgi:hypothetical protein
VKDGDQFKPVLAEAVGDEVGRVRHYKLARTYDSPWPADFRVILQEVDCLQDAASDKRGVLRRVPCDVRAQMHEMAYRSPGPDDLHRGALLSPGFPQDFNHFETLSWLTACAESSSAIPA